MVEPVVFAARRQCRCQTVHRSVVSTRSTAPASFSSHHSVPPPRIAVDDAGHTGAGDEDKACKDDEGVLWR